MRTALSYPRANKGQRISPASRVTDAARNYFLQLAEQSLATAAAQDYLEAQRHHCIAQLGEIGLIPSSDKVAVKVRPFGNIGYRLVNASLFRDTTTALPVSFLLHIRLTWLRFPSLKNGFRRFGGVAVELFQPTKAALAPSALPGKAVLHSRSLALLAPLSVPEAFIGGAEGPTDAQRDALQTMLHKALADCSPADHTACAKALTRRLLHQLAP